MKIRFVLAGMICLGLLASCKNATEEIVVSFDESQNASSYTYAGTAEGSVRYVASSSSSSFKYTASIDEDRFARIAYEKSDSSKHTNIQSYTLTVPVKLTTTYTNMYDDTTRSDTTKSVLTISFSKIGADYYNNDEKITVDGSPESNSFTFNDTVLPDADNRYIFSNLTFTRK